MTNPAGNETNAPLFEVLPLDDENEDQAGSLGGSFSDGSTAIPPGPPNHVPSAASTPYGLTPITTAENSTTTIGLFRHAHDDNDDVQMALPASHEPYASHKP